MRNKYSSNGCCTETTQTTRSRYKSSHSPTQQCPSSTGLATAMRVTVTQFEFELGVTVAIRQRWVGY